jgi:hypothetical protein
MSRGIERWLSDPECLRAGRSSAEKHFFRRKSDSDLLQNVEEEFKKQRNK